MHPGRGQQLDEEHHRAVGQPPSPTLSIQDPYLSLRDPSSDDIFYDNEKGALLGHERSGSSLCYCLPYVPRRYILAVVGFLGFINVYGAPTPPFLLGQPFYDVIQGSSWLVTMID
jgi:hypothetical protein